MRSKLTMKPHHFYSPARVVMLVFALLTFLVTGASAQFGAPASAPTVYGSAGKTTPQTAPQSGPAANKPATSPALPSNYVLKPNDEIQIRVFRNTELDGLHRISKDGTIDFPLLGIVTVSGKTSYEAAAHIAALLDKDYLVRPQVLVNVSTVSKRYFDILGEVTNPGTKEYPDDRDLDILGAVSLAGGWTKTASQVNVIVKRRVQGEDQLIKVDVARMTKERGMATFVVLPNDVIIVRERLL